MDEFDKMMKKRVEEANFPKLGFIDPSGVEVELKIDAIVSEYPHKGSRIYLCMVYGLGTFWLGKYKTKCACCDKMIDAWVDGKSKRDVISKLDSIKNGSPCSI